MLSCTSTKSKPLTPLMLAALQHLASRHDQALVRLHSNYWMTESDAKSNPLFREMRDFDDRFLASGSFFEAHQQPLIVFKTPTINAMVVRGLLKLTGPKRVVGATGNRKDFARAVLTSQATAMRAAMEDQSQAAYDEVMSRLR